MSQTHVRQIANLLMSSLLAHPRLAEKFAWGDGQLVEEAVERARRQVRNVLKEETIERNRAEREEREQGGQVSERNDGLRR